MGMLRLFLATVVVLWTGVFFLVYNSLYWEEQQLLLGLGNMGGFKKYEAHSKHYSLCCFRVDIHSLTMAIASLGVAFSAWNILYALVLATPYSPSALPSSDGGFGLRGGYIACAYLASFACTLMGQLFERPNYLLVFLLTNGFTIITTFISMVATMLTLITGPDPLGYSEEDLESSVQHYWERSFKIANATAVKGQRCEYEEAQLSLLLLLSMLTSIFLLASMLQSIVYHAYRVANLRQQFDYPQMDLVFPVYGIGQNQTKRASDTDSGCNGGGSSRRSSPPSSNSGSSGINGNVGNGGHYISNMKKTSIFGSLPLKRKG